MFDKASNEHQIQVVNNFKDLVENAFQGEINAICWSRKLQGDFYEICEKIEVNENIVEIDQDQLRALDLSEQGQLARQIILDDFTLLKNHGASPVLNIIKSYDRDDSLPFFPTDVYSFHVDRSPIPTDTFLCTYFGECSEILPNSQGEQKILIPEIREELKKIYSGNATDFDSFLTEYFFDLHYQPKINAQPIRLGLGQLWRIAVDHPESKVLPCLHRAPIEKKGEYRLLMIC